jgi:Ca-activated chloride channel homolog
MRSGCLTLLLIALVLHCSAQPKVQQKVPDKTRILFVLDGSGSMDALWGTESRMDIAKRILVKLVDSLRANKNLELALRVYGHRYTRQANNCQDSNLEVPFARGNHGSIVSKIREIKPKGVTPITYSILQAAKDFPSDKGYRNILILITDGIESCGADPCAASIELQKKGVFLRPFIIGLGITGGKVLDCMGKFIDSKNDENFNQALNEAIETTFSKTTASVEILNNNGEATETNVNITFTNSMTGLAVYDFVHYLDKSGRPDSVQIDPVLSYDVILHTLPPVVLANVNIRNGKHNLVRIPAPQGSLIVKPEARGNSFSVLVREKGQSRLLHQQRSGESVRFIAGTYEVETLTLPRRVFDVKVEADKVKTISIPQAGLLNLNTVSSGYGSLFEILESGESRFVCNLEEDITLHSYNLLPGIYKVAFRVKKAGGSKYTAIKNFTIESEKTLNLSMF